MARNLAIVTIHGVGPHRPGYARRFQEAITARFEAKRLADHIHIEPVHWGHVLEGRHRDLLRRLEAGGKLRHRGLRKFMLAAIGEVGAYREINARGHSLYNDVHDAVRDGLARARDAVGAGGLLLLAGHSLGSVILSDHVWDEQHGQGRGRNPFERCETLAGIVTLGSPLALLTLPLERVQAIEFPGKRVQGALRKRAAWSNIYDPDDIIGWPLRPTAPPYADVVADDIRLNIGNWLTSWNPLSHMGYWEDKDVHDVVEKQAESLIRSR